MSFVGVGVLRRKYRQFSSAHPHTSNASTHNQVVSDAYTVDVSSYSESEKQVLRGSPRRVYLRVTKILRTPLWNLTYDNSADIVTLAVFPRPRVNYEKGEVEKALRMAVDSF